MPRVFGKHVRDEFFTQSDPNSAVWTCKCGTRRKHSGRGYTNFVSHVQSEHPSDLNVLCAEKESSTNTLRVSKPISLFYPRKTLHAHGWLEFIVKGLLPFTVAENPIYTAACRFDSMSYKTVMKFLGGLTKHVESEISRRLPSNFALVFDGWTADNTHYVAIFATFPANTKHGYEKFLLGFSPFEDEEGQSAANHFEYLKFVLSVFGKPLSNVVALIGDNCSTNKLLADLCGVHFVGCASHRFNLAMKDRIREHQPIIENIRAIMHKLSYPIPAAKLRNFTHLRAYRSNVTRWSSTAHMLKRYMAIKELLPLLNIDEIDALTLSTRQNRKVESLCEEFSSFDSITKALQNDDISMADARVLFDTVIEEFPQLSVRLGSMAAIIHHPEFESGIVKIMEKRVSAMSPAELFATEKLKSAICAVRLTVDERSLSLAERALKRRKSVLSYDSEYMDLRFIVPTSNMCERFFSIAGYALDDRRRSVIPANFEKQMFLHANSDVWGIEDVNAIVTESS